MIKRFFKEKLSGFDEVPSRSGGIQDRDGGERDVYTTIRS